MITQGVLRGLDNLVDDENITDLSGAIQTISEGQPISRQVARPVAQVFSDLLGQYSDERRESLLSGLRNWPSLERQKREATTFDEYVQGIRSESLAYSSLMKAIRPRESMEQDELCDEVDSWIQDYISAGYYADCARDLAEDHQQGRCPIPPTLARRLELYRLTVVEGGAATLKSTPPGLFPKIGTLTLHYAIQ